MSRRGAVGAAVLVAWAAGFGLLARRRALEPESERIAANVINVQPGAAYFTISQAGQQIGWASARVDTTGSGVRVNYTATADVPLGGRLQRAAIDSRVLLSRRFELSWFTLAVRWPDGSFRITGTPATDTSMTLLTRTGKDAPDTLRLHTTAAVLVPSVIPLAVTLGRPLSLGETREFRVFDPVAMGERTMRLRVVKDSTFVVNDSTHFDSASKRWQGVLPTPTHAFKLVSGDSAGGTVAWVDAAGQLVRLEYPGGFTLERQPYEVAYENWRADAADAPRTVTADRDILESTAIAARSPLGTRTYERMRVQLSGADLSAFQELASERQTDVRGLVTVERESGTQLDANYTLPMSNEARARFPTELAPEPLIESARPEIVDLAARIVGGERDPRLAAERIARWVHDSLAKDITFGLPDAVQVLRARRGDCNEHTALFIALARATGIPARSAAGLAYVNGKFYYHAWPEIYLARWVPVDPTFGEFPADASHLRFVVGGLERQAALLRLIGTLKIDVLSAR